MKNLGTVLDGLHMFYCQPSMNLAIEGMSHHAQDITPGMLFAALPGQETDGHQYISQALAQGAVAVLCERPPAEEGPWIVVENSRKAWAELSANWFDHPAQKLQCIGVTGTNGKTTTTYLLKQVLEQSLHTVVGLIGTNEVLIGQRSVPVARTTPEAYHLQETLAQMVEAGCSHVVMEVSSHGLVLHRVHGIPFVAGIFTNLTQDHLDFHGSMEVYGQAKAKLFDQCQLAILNLDDDWGQQLAQTCPCPVYTYSERRDEADLVAKNCRLFPSHVEFEVVARATIGRVFLPIPGGFTIYNALAVVACSLKLGLPLPSVLTALRRVKGVKGRIEVVPVPRAYTVLIDYAHTPDALEQILTTVRDLTERRVICLFGCGGNRDREKRFLMGEIAADLADLCILTSDNPRWESPQQIIEEIQLGFIGRDTPYLVEPDREKAIGLALDQARAGDVVVLAGKGHETYQEREGQWFKLDERNIISKYYHIKEQK